MSSDNPPIRVRELSKCYEIYDRPQDRLKQSIYPRLQRLIGLQPQTYYREFWALKDVSFEVNNGEAVGIIGRNGAGKSTLLQMICGILSPTSGTVEVDGTVAALLELGSGFNPEFTGRENVYLNASMLGLSQEQIEDKFDEIAVFADIGDFLEQPIKTYSSGMLMRLAFAVNTCVDPKILIVDEALGVGDAPFQAKCFKRLRKLLNDGTTVLFVSHDISTIRSFCSQALWLKNGRAELWGEAKAIAKEYERFCWQEQGVVIQTLEPNDTKLSESSSVQGSSSGDLTVAPSILFDPNPSFEATYRRSRFGNGAVVIKNFLMLNKEGFHASSCEWNEVLSFFYLLEVYEPVNSDFILGIRVRDTKGNFVYSGNDISAIHRLEAKPGDRFVASTDIKMPLASQEYVVLTGIFGFKDGLAFTNGVYDYFKAVIWDVVEDAAYFKVHPFKLMPLVGPVNTAFNLRINKITSGSCHGGKYPYGCL
jgi:lipopolysaccharide transport system ATP-binding protein